MADAGELHRRAGEAFKDVLRAARDDQWHHPTPCTEWDVRALAHHVAWSNLWVAPLVEGRSLAEVAPTVEGDVLGADPVGVALRSVDEASDAFGAPGALQRPVQLSRGESPALVYCTERLNDLLLHAWDLARALGREVALDEEGMEVALAYYRPLEPLLRPIGELGPDVEVEGGADLQTRFLAFFGRRPGWTPPD